MIAAIVLSFAALLIDPNEIHIKAAQTAYEQGRQAQAQNDAKEATECFRKAISIEPTFLDAREALIDVYLKSGDQLAAAASITQFLEIKPDVLRYRLLLGQILLNQKQAEKALAQFSLVLKQDPYNADGLLGFSSAARQLGMKDRAEAAIERGRKKYPADQRFRSAPECQSPKNSK